MEGYVNQLEFLTLLNVLDHSSYHYLSLAPPRSRLEEKMECARILLGD